MVPDPRSQADACIEGQERTGGRWSAQWVSPVLGSASGRMSGNQDHEAPAAGIERRPTRGAGVTRLNESTPGVTKEIYDAWARENSHMSAKFAARDRAAGISRHQTAEGMKGDQAQAHSFTSVDSDDYAKRMQTTRRIKELELMKKRATCDEDYSAAHEIKLEIERLRAAETGGELALHLSPQRVRVPPGIGVGSYSAV